MRAGVDLKAAAYPCMVYVRSIRRRADEASNVVTEYPYQLTPVECVANDAELAAQVSLAVRTAEEGMSCALFINGKPISTFTARPKAPVNPPCDVIVEEYRP